MFFKFPKYVGLTFHDKKGIIIRVELGPHLELLDTLQLFLSSKIWTLGRQLRACSVHQLLSLI